ncbi:MAG: LysM peptidoglycan-binding domain-containing protein [Anaerolineales bacterium]|nr:LysM peptidoglycan-binding domain-containing protein [Anaerolineales bacterium]
MRNSNRFLISTLAAFLILGIGLPLSSHQEGRLVYAKPSLSSASELIAEVNTLRASNGLWAYTANSILMGTAQSQANYMASIGAWTHEGPGGISTTQRLLNAGYPLAGDLSMGGFRSENVTMGTNKTAADAVQEWTGDAAHLNTMLSTNLTEIGAGVAVVGNTYYYVIDCARPTGDGQPQESAGGYTTDTNEGASASDFIIPITLSTPDQNGNVYHEVQYGQSLWSIAIEYGTKIDIIRQLNGLSGGSEIYQGQKLLVMVVDTPTPVPPTASPTFTVTPITPTATVAKTTLTVSTESDLVETQAADALVQSKNSTGALVLIVILTGTLLAAGFGAFAAMKKEDV